MFTGIIEDVGVIKEVDRRGQDVLLSVETRLNVEDIKIGESILVDGPCLTVIAVGKNTFTVEASYETLRRTTLSKVKPGDGVNLERALKLGDRLGGHIVNGHVDGVGRVESVRARGKSTEIKVSLPQELSKYVVEKGSIAINGVSLTINTVGGSEFSVNIIPWTSMVTTLGTLKPGDIVNIECDILGKYIEKFLAEREEKENMYKLLEKL